MTILEWCKLSAICMKLDDDQFIKEACPTCDLVSCPKGEVCEMVSGKPACVEIQLGPCDKNPCGSATCTADGDSHTCSCKAGYKYKSKCRYQFAKASKQNFQNSCHCHMHSWFVRTLRTFKAE